MSNTYKYHYLYKFSIHLILLPAFLFAFISVNGIYKDGINQSNLILFTLFLALATMFIFEIKARARQEKKICPLGLF